MPHCWKSHVAAHIDTISMELSSLVASQKYSIKWHISVPEDCFYLSKHIIHGISSGLSLFAKVPVYFYSENKVRACVRARARVCVCWILVLLISLSVISSLTFILLGRRKLVALL